MEYKITYEVEDGFLPQSTLGVKIDSRHIEEGASVEEIIEFIEDEIGYHFAENVRPSYDIDKVRKLAEEIFNEVGHNGFID